ncbi:hypothetical protein OK016_12045 [Vibrio chagasii]|nr:hypothetical protein [Vibrio chagasii]
MNVHPREFFDYRKGVNGGLLKIFQDGYLDTRILPRTKSLKHWYQHSS